jgi:hypothetical protein
LFLWGALSDERTCLSFVYAAGPRQRRLPCDHILLSQILDFPFRRLLRLAGSRLRYSNPPPHGCYSSYIDSARTPRKTRPLLLHSADLTENTTHMVPTQRVHWRADCRLATSYEHSSYCCMFTISLPSNGNALSIVGQEFLFAGTCLSSCSLATDIHVTI